MEWRGRRGSSNIEDRRSMTGRAGGIGIVGMLIVLAVGYFFGIDISPLVSQSGIGNPQQTAAEPLSEEDKAAGQMVSVVLAETEQVWDGIFRDQLGRAYTPTRLVLYKGVTQSPCGGASGATGPFYCPADKKVYLDTAFFTTMERQMGAGGEFAAAYVVAHEVGHHVQNELGILPKANAARQRADEVTSNDISVRVELQADCFSGVWAAHSAKALNLSEQDVLEAVNAAKAVGDDTLQASAGRVPMPDSFTHGSSEQRKRWLITGMRSGDVNSCDTFSAQQL
ncbi:neutral zinc metallopeptidase [Paracoccus sp. p4-l81]|uniref:KPN_02809 family neutral zinc metallopeptidase n=1 Tax=Paracoccus sp. p4-l81 TaxID=3342806 RepID=UPI0035BB505B